MADLTLALTIDGDTGPLQTPVAIGDVKVLRVTATDGAGGSAMAATGVSLTLAMPDGSQDVLTVGAGLTAGATGIWTADVEFDAVGTWRAVARATGPTAAASSDIAVAVSGSTADLPIPTPAAPTGEILADDIADSTATGRALLTADDPADARAVATIGTGSLSRLPVEWVEIDYATELGGATLGTDARKVIQYAWNLAAESGSRCTLGTPGTYDIDSSQASAGEWPNGPTADGSNRGCLVVATGLDFEAGPGVFFESAVSIAGARGMITTDRGDYRADGHTPPSDVTIRGGVWGKRGGASTTATGSVFGLEVDNLRLIETMVDGWQQGRAYNLAGNGHRHYRPGMRNPAGDEQSGGMRFWYGDDFDCDGPHGVSGDDFAQLVTNFDPDGFWFGNITNAWYRNARGTSNEARGAAVALPAQNGTTPTAAGMSNYIWHSGYVDCLFVAGAGGVAVNVQNQNSSGAVRDLVFRRCIFDQTASSETNGLEVFGAWGGVEDVLFDLCTLIGSGRDLVSVEGRVRNPVFRGCRLYAPRDESSSFRPIRIKGASGMRFEGGFAEMMATAPGSPANALFDLGISTSTDTYSGDTYTTTLDGAWIGGGFEARNIRSSAFAVRTTRANQLEIDGVKLVRASGATASSVKFLSVVGSANGSPIILRDCDLTDSTDDETEAVSDANGIVIRQGFNQGIKAPIQAIANANNDNGIIGPGVIRAELTTTGATYAITLGAPALADRVAGRLVIEMVARGGSNNVTLTLTNVTNLGGSFTTATWSAVGDFLVLVPRASSWWLLENNSVALS